ncbi:MAG: methionyl-tRNA formyltransferase [Bacilli bacterium]
MTKILFMGTPAFAVPILENLIKENYNIIGVVTQPDRPKGRKKELTPPPVKECALAHGIPVYQPEKIRLEEEYTPIIALGADLIITAAFGQILPKALLDAPKYGCINVHGSLLPELRGGAPIHYAILQGKKESGITIMYMAEQLDAGDMLTKKVVPITEEDNTGTLHDKLQEAGVTLLSETLPKLLAGELKAEPQNHELATFAPNIKREDEKVDWNKSVEHNHNHIRGLAPWPVAFTTLHENNIKLWSAVKSDQTTDAQPGTILNVSQNGVEVACGDNGVLVITEWQLPGKKRSAIAQAINGMNTSEYVGKVLR